MDNFSGHGIALPETLKKRWHCEREEESSLSNGDVIENKMAPAVLC